MATVLLVGTGAVGARAARQLLDTAGVTALLLAGRRLARVEELASALGAKARAVAFRPGDPLPNGVDAVAVAAPSEVDVAVAAAAVDAGVPFASATDATSAVDGLFALDHAAVEAGVTLAAGCGLAPGLADVLVVHAVHALEGADEVHVARAGAAGPASQASVRRALREPALEWRDGSWHEERGHGPELVWFPEPIGQRECMPVGSSIRLLARAVPGLGAATMRFCEPTSRRVSWFGESPDARWGATTVTVWGWRGRNREPIVYGVVGETAILAATVLAVTAARLAGDLPALSAGGSALAGVRSLAELVVPVAFLAEMARRGVKAVAFEGVAVA